MFCVTFVQRPMACKTSSQKGNDRSPEFFSIIKILGYNKDAQGQLTLLSPVQLGRNINSYKILGMPSLPASLKESDQ